MPGPDDARPPLTVVTRLRDGFVRIADEPGRAGEGDAAADGVRTHVVEDDDHPDFTDPRSALLGRPDAHRLWRAVAVGQWRHRARFCQRCGQPLIAEDGGQVLRCADGHQEFPRIEPAVIMRVVDADDRIVLARQAAWPAGRVSVLAGFVDPGEALEDTVRREVHEEVGVHVDAVTYVRSQPWPFPSSLMLAFHAIATTTDLRLLDGEIAEAAWWTRDELRRAMAEGRIAMPTALSVAHRLIADWLGDGDLAVWRDGPEPASTTSAPRPGAPPRPRR